MIKSNLSPRLTVRSPKALDLPGKSKKLPSIKDRNSMVPMHKYENSELKSEVIQKQTHKVINFFDIPTPVDEKKLAIVRNTLEKRKVTSLTNTSDKDSEKNSAINTNISYKNSKSELELQIEFLSSKKSVLNLEKSPSFDVQMKDSGSPISTFHQANEISLNFTGSVKKSESALIFPSFSPTKYTSDLSPEPVQSKDQADLILLLKQEISALQQINAQLTQDLAQQHYSLENQSRTYITEKEALLKDQQDLKNHIAILQRDLEQALALVKSLKKGNKALKSELNSLKDNKSDSTTKTEAKIFLLNEEIQEKEKEFEIVKEQLKNSEIHRKKFVEVSKDLELELLTYKKNKEFAEKQVNEFSLKYEEILNELRQEKSRTVVVDELKQENFQVKYEISLIKEENQRFEMDKRVAQESLETVQKNFNSSRIAWREKETSNNKMIQDLLDQIQSEKTKAHVHAAETAKLRRALTFKDNDSVNNLSRDEISRYQQKLIQLDKENSDFLVEIDKLKRNIDYYRHIVRSKEEIIRKLEESSENTQENSKIEKVHDFLIDFQRLVQCGKCFIVTFMFILQPCCHLFCENCANTKVCPICTNSVIGVNSYNNREKLKGVCVVIEPLLKSNE